MHDAGQGALAQGLHACHICTGVSPVDVSHCNRCGAHVHTGWEKSMQQTWAWLITSIVLYLPANFLPILHTQFLGKYTESTILGGVVDLWHHGSYPIATIIFVASVLVPICKILILIWLCLSVRLRSTFAVKQKTALYRITEFVGRWSMIDVFVVAILVALIQLGSVMTVLPGSAALAFAAMVATTMMAAITFDPRLLWTSDD